MKGFLPKFFFKTAPTPVRPPLPEGVVWSKDSLDIGLFFTPPELEEEYWDEYLLPNRVAMTRIATIIGFFGYTIVCMYLN